MQSRSRESQVVFSDYLTPFACCCTVNDPAAVTGSYPSFDLELAMFDDDDMDVFMDIPGGDNLDDVTDLFDIAATGQWTHSSYPVPVCLPESLYRDGFR